MTVAKPLGVDVDALLMQILKPRMPIAPDRVPTVAEFVPGDKVDRYPFIRAHRPPASGAAVDPRWLDRARVVVDVFDNDRTNAIRLALICRAAFFEAWTNQTIYPLGSVASYEETAAPAVLQLPGAPKGEIRVQALYLLGISPSIS